MNNESNKEKMSNKRSKEKMNTESNKEKTSNNKTKKK
jgi:hypothetical protein